MRRRHFNQHLAASVASLATLLVTGALQQLSLIHI